MRRLARAFLYLSAILWTVALLSPFVTTAWAEIDSDKCDATIKGVDVRGRSSTSAGDAIDVDQNEVVNVTFTSQVGFESHNIHIELAGVRGRASSGTHGGDTSFTDNVNVKDWAFVSGGLHKVIGSATLSDGSSCSGAALINVKRNPLTTVVGGVAAATTAVGVAGVGASAAASSLQGIRAGRKVEEWITDEMESVGGAPPADEGARASSSISEESIQSLREGLAWGWANWWWACVIGALPALLLTGAAMVGGGGSPPAQEPRERLPRVGWRPRISAAGLLGGLLGGAGIVVLLQQYAVTPLTRSLAIEGLVIGLVVGLVLPSLVRVWSMIHVNGAIGKAERRLNEALAQAGPPPEGSQAPPTEPQP